jgi:hypothetical protein
VTDNTAGFSAALTAASNADGGAVFAPPGLYRFKGSLTIPAGVTLTGSYEVVPSHDLRNHQPLNDGTILIPTGGRGTPCDINCTAAFITVTENGLLRGSSFFPRSNFIFHGHPGVSTASPCCLGYTLQPEGSLVREVA